MNPTSGEPVGRLLARYALQGLITLEDLDDPPANWQRLEADRLNANARAQRIARPPVYPPAKPWRNLAREWIAAHPSQWEAMVRDALAMEDSPEPLPPLTDDILSLGQVA